MKRNLDGLIREAARCYAYQTRMDALLHEIAPGRSMVDATDPLDPVLEEGRAQGIKDADDDFKRKVS